MRSLCVLVLVCAATVPAAASTAAETGGHMVTRDGKRTVEVPLEHTAVRVRVDGNLVDARVVQRFRNPYPHAIEAVYLFPLPTGAAVNAMTLRHGGRTIRGAIRERAQARAVYERARARGKTAALLEQQRPNLFTQSVAGLAPGAVVEVELRYVEPLVQRDGGYELVFPMVAPPRYLPGAARDRDVQPALLPPEVRSAHDIDLQVELDAGMPMRDLLSPSHQVRISAGATSAAATVALHPLDTIPNRDFLLRWKVAGDRPQFAVLANRGGDDSGQFLLLAQPPAALADADAAPREIIFVIDTSTSMAGAPLRAATTLIRKVLAGLRPDDTYQIVRFSDSASALGPGPLAARPRNLSFTHGWLDQLRAGGGTEMTAGIAAALAVPHDPARLRIVAFLTDGYVGNEDQILKTVGEQLGASRLFAFGIGSAVNRYLLEEMALIGRGAVQVVTPSDDPAAAAATFAARIDRAALTDVTIDWGGLRVADVSPPAIPDLFVGEPLVLAGRYREPGVAQVTVRARSGGRPVQFVVPVVLPARAERPAIGAVWARRRIADFSRSLIRRKDAALVAEITRLGLEHQLVTAYTSFVAVDEQAQATGPQRRVVVPVEVPAAADRALATSKGGFGSIGTGSYGTIGYGSGSGVSYGIGSGGGGMYARRSAVPQVRIGNAVVTSALDKNVIRRYVRMRLNAIRYCYERARLKEPTLAGTVTVHFAIDKTGMVVQARADGMKHPVVENCIADVVRRIRFPATDEGLVQITYPFVLQPAE
jgi:Ca-activated chloride channel family protein